MENNYASAQLRFLGGLVDWLIRLGGMLLILLRVSQASDLLEIYDSLLYLMTFYLLWGMGSWLIQAYLISRFGGSVGNMLTGVKVVSERGVNLTFWRAVFRSTIGALVSSMFLCLGYIWILVDQKRQGWHDQISQNFVICPKSKTFLGLLSLTVFLLLNIYLVNLNISGFRRNQEFYKTLIRDLKIDIQEFSDTPPSDLPIEGDLPISYLH